MAKPKKNTKLAIDKSIPAEQYPYSIPQNWCWTYGKNLLKKMESAKPTGDYFNYIDIDAINNEYQIISEPKIIETSKAPSRASRKLHCGDTLFSLVRPYLRNIAYVDENAAECIASTGFYVCTPKDCIDNRFLYWLMVSPYVVNGLNSYMKGDNSPSIRGEVLETFLYPLPPIQEQKRIVNIIEALFPKLDEAKEIVEGVIDKLELQKESIFLKAFSGELTSEWRRKKGLSKETWKHEELGTFLEPMKSKKPSGEAFRYIDIDAIDNKQQLVREPKITPTEKAPSRASREVQKDDVIISMVRPYLKNIAYITEDLADCIASTGFYVCRCKDGLYSRYLYEYLRSKKAVDYLMKFMKGDNSPSIRKEHLLGMKIDIPSTEEQIEISNIINRTMEHEEQVKTLGLSVIDSIEVMKKSILTKAFRCELGTNDLSEESSIELLKQIIANE